MLWLIVRRFLYAVPIAIGVTVVCFSLVHLAPGDPLNAVVGPDAPADVVEADRVRERELAARRDTLARYLADLGA